MSNKSTFHQLAEAAAEWEDAELSEMADKVTVIEEDNDGDAIKIWYPGNYPYF
jgi:hypothetical protein